VYPIDTLLDPYSAKKFVSEKHWYIGLERVFSSEFGIRYYSHTSPCPAGSKRVQKGSYLQLNIPNFRAFIYDLCLVPKSLKLTKHICFLGHPSTFQPKIKKQANVRLYLLLLFLFIFINPDVMVLYATFTSFYTF
jgi:hypothetical protein